MRCNIKRFGGEGDIDIIICVSIEGKRRKRSGGSYIAQHEKIGNDWEREFVSVGQQI